MMPPVLGKVAVVKDNSVLGRLVAGKVAENKAEEGRTVERVKGMVLEGRLVKGRLEQGRLVQGRLVKGRLEEDLMAEVDKLAGSTQGAVESKVDVSELVVWVLPLQTARADRRCRQDKEEAI